MGQESLAAKSDVCLGCMSVAEPSSIGAKVQPGASSEGTSGEGVAVMARAPSVSRWYAFGFRQQQIALLEACNCAVETCQCLDNGDK
jgi:hypothetical protein